MSEENYRKNTWCVYLLKLNTTSRNGSLIVILHVCVEGFIFILLALEPILYVLVLSRAVKIYSGQINK